jgi:hypothetical protein
MMKTTKEKMEVMQAFLDGKLLQRQSVDCPTGRWHRVGTEPAWNWFGIDYRVKPEPKVIWVNEYKSEFDVIRHSKEEAEEDAGSAAIRVAVKYREVLGAE